MGNIDLSKLSAEQLNELEAKIAAEKTSADRRRRESIEAYKDLVSESVTEAFEVLKEQSTALAQTKARVYKMFEKAREMKSELFDTKPDGQWSHTFCDRDGNLRIRLGVNTLDNYDDTAEDGIAMVNGYLDSLAKDNPNAQQAVKICRSLMARDRNGNLKPSKIVTLRNHAAESGDAKFIEGVDVIMAAYKPVASKTYIRAEYKNGQGAWVNLPLGITEAEEL